MTQTVYERLQGDVDSYGECHATLEEHDHELEIRRGQVTWGDDQFTLVSNGELHVFAADAVVSYYLPEAIFDG